MSTGFGRRRQRINTWLGRARPAPPLNGYPDEINTNDDLNNFLRDIKNGRIQRANNLNVVAVNDLAVVNLPYILDKTSFIQIEMRFMHELSGIVPALNNPDADAEKDEAFKTASADMKKFLCKHRYRNKSQRLFFCRSQYLAWKNVQIDALRNRLKVLKNINPDQLRAILTYIGRRIEMPTETPKPVKRGRFGILF